MKLRQWLLAVFLCLFWCAAALPNGEDFFMDALTPGPHPLLFTGRVTDPDGKAIPNVRVYVEIPRLSLLMEVHADSDGQFQTHDLNKALEMIGEKIVPGEMTLFVKRVYYTQLSANPAVVPKAAEGRFNMNFVMGKS